MDILHINNNTALLYSIYAVIDIYAIPYVSQY